MKSTRPFQRFLDDLADNSEKFREHLKNLGFDVDGTRQSAIYQYLRELGFDPDGARLSQFLTENNPQLHNSFSSKLPEIQSSLPTKPVQKLSKRARWKASIGTHAAARKMEAYIESKGMDLKEFAERAGTTDRTLRKFRKTGLIRRSCFDGIAAAMGLTRDELLKS